VNSYSTKVALIGIAACLVIGFAIYSNNERFDRQSAEKSSVTVGVVGTEPVLYPDMDDGAVWQKATVPCMNDAGKSATLVNYIRPVTDGVAVAIAVLSLEDIRVAYRVGYFGGSVAIEVVHVRNFVANNWVKYELRIPKEERAAQLRTMEELGMSEKKFRQCFGTS